MNTAELLALARHYGARISEVPYDGITFTRSQLHRFFAAAESKSTRQDVACRARLTSLDLTATGCDARAYEVVGEPTALRAALEADAARYRWLRDPDRIPDDEGDGHIIVGAGSGEDILWSEQLDAAIDAALALQQEPKP